MGRRVVSLSRSDFGSFFAAVNDGPAPYRWQQRLLDHLLGEGRWPDRLVAPTGAGKTSVVDVHVFANALHALGLAPRIPRRLAMVVDRRVVVDSHDAHARRIAARLSGATRGVVADVADALRGLTVDGPTAARDPLVTARIRGGSPAPRSWLDSVDSCLVLACTPDMWGSRLLLRGYGASRTARPRAAGLFAMDAAVVVDEAHLARQLLLTARRVADLQRAAHRPIGVPVLQVVETTATPDTATDLTEVGVAEDDLVPGDTLTARMTTPKPVTLAPLKEWPVPRTGPGRREAVRVIADLVAGLRGEAGPTVGCVLDTVALAVDVAQELRRGGLVVELVVGRLRPADLGAIRDRWPGLLGPTGNTGVDVLVATQTIEVGIDLDLTALVTELAPGTALVQRSGRVNRAGSRPSGPITVVVPGAAGMGDGRRLPYDHDDLVAAHAWLDRVAGRPDGLAPWSARAERPPAAGRHRLAWSRLEMVDSWQLARTSIEQLAEHFLDLWLSDDLEADSDVGLVARELPDDQIAAVELLRSAPPEPHEVFPVAIGKATQILARAFDELGRDPAAADEGNDDAVGVETARTIGPLVVRAGETRALLSPDDRLRPGDVVVLVPRLVPTTAGVPDPEGAGSSSDVFETGRPNGEQERATLRLGDGTMLPVDHGDPAAADAVRRLLLAASAAGPELDSRAAHALLVEELTRLHDVLPLLWGGVVARCVTLLRGRLSDAEVTVSGTGTHQWLVVTDRRRATADDDLRQTWRVEEVDPTLDGHQAAVADRVARLGRVLGLTDDLVDGLRDAGAHHDDGKADVRFQRMLRFGSSTSSDGSPGLLAKSSGRTPRRDELARASGDLPDGWRHEQLSVISAWSALDHATSGQRQLVVRLVGTTHGHGRPSFRHGSSSLLDPGDTSLTVIDETERQQAMDLFDVGTWEQLVEETDVEWGVWGMAFLEAVLRAADGAVSSGLAGPGNTPEGKES